MSRRVPKSVSLSPLCDNLVSRHFQMRGQFSAFVRAAILDYDERVSGGGGHTPIEGLGICNGVRRPTCSFCYPDGPPTRENWLKFMGVREAFDDPDRDGTGELTLARRELLESIEGREPTPRVDAVTGSFPERLTRMQRLWRWISAIW